MSSQPDSNTIMIVDDTPVNLKLLEMMLKEQDYRVRSFPRGVLALKSALIDPPDLIFLDINMPEMNGYEVCQHLKSDPRTRDIPVIFISALTETLDKVKAFQTGGVDYITKPFQFEEVHARAEVQLRLVRAQRAIEDKNELLRRTLADLKAAQQHLVQSEKLAALGVLTAGIAHEINNPVNFIKTSALGLRADIHDLQQLLELYEHCRADCQHPSLPERIDALKAQMDYNTVTTEIEMLLDHIQEGVRRTEEVVNSLRAYSRMDALADEKNDVHALINASLVILKPRYKESISIEKIYGSVPALQVQPGRLIQVFTNILSNAIDAILGKAAPQGTITIRTTLQARESASYVAIEFCDTGPGIPEAIRDKVFDPFFTTKDVGKGTGLGLSISLGIIQDHNGQIEITNISGAGTRVAVLLPVEKEAP